MRGLSSPLPWCPRHQARVIAPDAIFTTRGVTESPRLTSAEVWRQS